MNNEQNLDNPQSQQLNIAGVISRLFDLQRFDIEPKWNGEFIEL